MEKKIIGIFILEPRNNPMESFTYTQDAGKIRQ